METIKSDLFEKLEKSEISNYSSIKGGFKSTLQSSTTCVYIVPREDYYSTDDGCDHIGQFN